MINTTTMTSINPFPTEMHSKMSSTGRPVEEISGFLLFTLTDDFHFGFYGLEKFRPLFQKRRRSLFFYKYLKLPKTTVKPNLQKAGHGIMVLNPTIEISSNSHLSSQKCE